MRASIARRSLIELIETCGERGRRPDIVGEQALNSHGHVIDASGRIEPWATPNARSAAMRPSRERPAMSSSARMPAAQRPARMRFNPCETRTRLLASSGTRSATVPRATRSRNSAAPGAPGGQPLLVEPPLQRRHHVEGHSHARERAALEETAGQVGIDDDIGRRNVGTRQMMVGDQHVDAERARRRHSGSTRDPIVHCDDERRRATRLQLRRSPA